MCKAGVRILDVYPLSAAYAGGTLDVVHYPSGVFVAVAQVLEDFFRSKKNADGLYFDSF
jgi:hypothetical protein